MLSNNSLKIEEKVTVVASFSQKLTPLLLVWRGKKIYLEKVNMLFEKNEGKKLFYFCYASDKEKNGYKLKFDTSRLTWDLEEITF